jgi:N-acetyl-anhydromuramyl-L-alanine amidase AmpD
VLQDERQLSAHFLLDLDGTLYQTLDLADQAWHAGAANARSIGVEIANVGAYPPDAREPLERWYAPDGRDARVTLPGSLGDGGIRTHGFVARPARPVPVRGPVQGEVLEQYDFTPEQYRSLALLTATLARTFPELRLDAPRDSSGRVRRDALSDAELAAFGGVLGHWHVSREKRDPGPAFDWERYLAAARAERAAP